MPKMPDIQTKTKPLITAKQLQHILKIKQGRALKWVKPINKVLRHYEIDTPLRIAAFIAQIGHESARLRYVREIWGPTKAQRRYEGRKDLGNIYKGDGKRFMGRGLIQVTGRANYAKCAKALDLPLLDNPKLLELPKNAAMSAGWFWSRNKLNRFADSQKFTTLTKRINGGKNGIADRRALYKRALEVLT